VEAPRSPPKEKMTGRPFPPPWRVVEMAGCFVVQDAAGQNVAWFYFRDDPMVAESAAVLLKERAKQRAVTFAGPLLDKADRD
jgi:hypothetical protein